MSMELHVFRTHAAHPQVHQALGEVTRKVAEGLYPRSSDVLSALFVMLAQNQ